MITSCGLSTRLPHARSLSWLALLARSDAAKDIENPRPDEGKQDRSGGARVGAGARVLLVRRIDDVTGICREGRRE
jgi:hypothetical protein